MKLRTGFALAAMLLVAAFAALNWQTFSQPAPLHFLFAQVDAPLGVVMLVLLGAITVLYMLLLARIEVTAMLESGRLARELERTRRLADDGAESSIHALQQHMDRQFDALKATVLHLAEQPRRPAQTGGPPEGDPPPQRGVLHSR